MRWSRALLPALLVVLLAACGGSSPSTGGNGDGSQGAQASSDTQASEPATESTAPEASSGSGNGNAGDLDQLASDLTPPNSSQTSRTEAEGIIFLTFDSSDSPEDLQSFYEDAISSTGYSVFSRTTVEGAYSWIFGIEDNSDFGGVVTVGPGTGSGSYVAVQIGATQ